MTREEVLAKRQVFRVGCRLPHLASLLWARLSLSPVATICTQELASDPNIYERLTASIAPSIWQLEDVKKGILCQLFGGVSKVRLTLCSNLAKRRLRSTLCIGYAALKTVHFLPCRPCQASGHAVTSMCSWWETLVSPSRSCSGTHCHHPRRNACTALVREATCSDSPAFLQLCSQACATRHLHQRQGFLGGGPDRVRHKGKCCMVCPGAGWPLTTSTGHLRFLFAYSLCRTQKPRRWC
jgi:hypothetical protein